MDYTYQYKRQVKPAELGQTPWDVFFSAYNKSERVNATFDAVSASRKGWVVHSEYGFDSADVPSGAYRTEVVREDEYILDYFQGTLAGIDVAQTSICVDVTGFMRPHMLYLVHYLAAKGAKRLDVLYAEPSHYSRLDDTRFASEHVETVRQVAGYEGYTNNETKNDLLLVNSGFEHQLTADVAEEKDKARKILMMGLPSLKADMYQQSVLRTEKARDALGDNVKEVFAPASDPFATATVLSGVVARERTAPGISNLYLSPLSTKPAALGFALYYLRECRSAAASIIFPFSAKYDPDASTGVGRIWHYTLEL